MASAWLFLTFGIAFATLSPYDLSLQQGETEELNFFQFHTVSQNNITSSRLLREEANRWLKIDEHLQLPESFNFFDAFPECSTKPRDQGTCGSGYAHAMAGAFGARLCKAMGGSTGEYSTQRIMDCPTSVFENAAGKHMQDSDGCSSGLTWLVALGRTPGGGEAFVREECSPYQSALYAKGSGRPRPSCPAVCPGTGAPPLRLYIEPQPADLGAIGQVEAYKRALLERGPMPANFYVYWEALLRVAAPDWTYRPTANDTLVGGHSALLVGWTANTWILQNSWGPDWGLAGQGLFHVGMRDPLALLEGFLYAAPDLVPQLPDFLFTEPPPGALLLPGQRVRLRWLTRPALRADAPLVNITLDAAGVNLGIVAASLPNSGVYEWTVPATLPEAPLYRLTIAAGVAAAHSEYFALSRWGVTVVASPAYSEPGDAGRVGPSASRETALAVGQAVSIVWGLVVGSGPGGLVDVDLVNITQPEVLLSIASRHNTTSSQGRLVWTVPPGLPLNVPLFVRVRPSEATAGMPGAAGVLSYPIRLRALPPVALGGLEGAAYEYGQTLTRPWQLGPGLASAAVTGLVVRGAQVPLASQCNSTTAPQCGPLVLPTLEAPTRYAALSLETPAGRVLSRPFVLSPGLRLSGRPERDDRMVFISPARWGHVVADLDNLTATPAASPAGTQLAIGWSTAGLWDYVDLTLAPHPAGAPAVMLATRLAAARGVAGFSWPVPAGMAPGAYELTVANSFAPHANASVAVTIPPVNCTALVSCAGCALHDGCGWCADTGRCMSAAEETSCPAASWRHGSCCAHLATCQTCGDAGAAGLGCGWCGPAGNGSCLDGWASGPSRATCPPAGWSWAHCPSACTARANCSSCLAAPGCGWCSGGASEGAGAGCFDRAQATCPLWSAQCPVFASGPHELTGLAGTLSDKEAGQGWYPAGQRASWRIAPQPAPWGPGNTVVEVTFGTPLDTGRLDAVTLYDGPNGLAPVLASFSGAAAPSGAVRSTGPVMYVEWAATGPTSGRGWRANYTAVSACLSEDCRGCAAQAGCGWCQASMACLTAFPSAPGPAQGSCSAWWGATCTEPCADHGDCLACAADAAHGCGWCPGPGTARCMPGGPQGPRGAAECPGWAWGATDRCPLAAPTVRGVDPSHGLATVSTTVTITGTGFAPGCEVFFCGVDAGLMSGSSRTLKVATPMLGPGRCDVLVVNPDRQNGTLVRAYTFDQRPHTPAPLPSCPLPSPLPFGGGSVPRSPVALVVGLAVGLSCVAFGGAGLALWCICRRRSGAQTDVLLLPTGLRRRRPAPTRGGRRRGPGARRPKKELLDPLVPDPLGDPY
ncbi:hypothetical protein PAPYR_4106 [Paratrimastix pyriformis]|uniref:CUB domain-containing protein n=1 Tax=Paratrimastix pyriformis TaxID=342808 RepID=A0ABQ8UKI4_9EUKA|nr:hypothetical protein PAPYR_4106 [Paratrimastix pyriformis]